MHAIAARTRRACAARTRAATSSSAHPRLSPRHDRPSQTRGAMIMINVADDEAVPVVRTVQRDAAPQWHACGDLPSRSALARAWSGTPRSVVRVGPTPAARRGWLGPTAMKLSIYSSRFYVVVQLPRRMNLTSPGGTTALSSPVTGPMVSSSLPDSAHRSTAAQSFAPGADTHAHAQSG
jgi:hypothetical protein